MKVQLGDREVWIEFNYLHHPVLGARRGEATQQEATQCLLRDGSTPRAKNEEAPLIVRGEVVRYFKDPPNRELARKAALTKALEELDHTLPYQDSATLDQDRSNHLLKQRRKLFWDAYLNRKRASPVQSRVLPASSNPSVTQSKP